MQANNGTLYIAYALSDHAGLETGAQMMSHKKLSKKSYTEISRLKQENARLKREKADLEMMMEVKHSDFLEETLFKKVESALRESEKRFRLISETMPAPIIVTRVSDNAIVYANDPAESLFGFSSKELLTHRITDFHDPADWNRLSDILVKQGYVSNYDIRGRSADNSLFWVVLFVQPLVFNDEPCLLNAFYDITERKLAEKALQREIAERAKAEKELKRLSKLLESRIARQSEAEKVLSESEKKYQSIFENAPEGIFQTTWASTDMNGRFIECNSGFCEMLGYSPGELHSLTYMEITPEKWHAEAKLFIKHVLKKGYSDVHETELIKKDGTIFPVEIRSYVIRDEQGKPEGFWGFVRDITEKRALQTEAMRQARLASVGELAAGVAHEINNPINCIINYAQILINRLGEQTEENEISKRIIKEGDRIEKIVRNLLSFAREGRQEKYLFHIKSILSECLELTQSMLQKDNITVRPDISDNLPMIRVNIQQIQQVFLNIISNARYALNQKHIGPDRNNKILKVKIELTDMEGHKYIRIIFHDNGTGIPLNILDRICDPFFSTKPANMGTGLGLSISYGIIKDHGGKLWFESTEGEYAKTVIDMPVDI